MTRCLPCNVFDFSVVWEPHHETAITGSDGKWQSLREDIRCRGWSAIVNGSIRYAIRQIFSFNVTEEEETYVISTYLENKGTNNKYAAIEVLESLEGVSLENNLELLVARIHYFTSQGRSELALSEKSAFGSVE